VNLKLVCAQSDRPRTFTDSTSHSHTWEHLGPSQTVLHTVTPENTSDLHRQYFTVTPENTSDLHRH